MYCELKFTLTIHPHHEKLLEKLYSIKSVLSNSHFRTHAGVAAIAESKSKLAKVQDVGECDNYGRF